MTSRDADNMEQLDGPVAERGARTRERVTPRTARYVIVGAEPAQARRIWFVLHGYGMLAERFLRPFHEIVPADTCIVAPEGLSRFYLELPRADGGHLQRVGATWLTRESRETEIADAHCWLDAVHEEVVDEAVQGTGAPPATAVLGFSQGVATAMRWTTVGRVRPQMFVAWAGGMAADADLTQFNDRLRDGEVCIVMGTNDPFLTPENRAAAEKARSLLTAPTQLLTFDGAHHLDTPTLSLLLRRLRTP
ncbi:MAG: hypothetical protein IT353_04365 [Gemmatimonadaceae bacterium]|nr:hypothetical protein [Gemmatimonadaceae bacterium]